MRYYVSAILFLLVPFHAFACSPQEPIMVPPKTPDGEFTYIHPPSAREQFIEDLSRSRSHAIVRIYIDHHRQSHPHDAQTEFKVLYGWGKPQLEIQKLIREETSCGAPESLEINALYMAIFPAYGLPQLMLYKDLESHIAELGEPAYVSTAVGRLPR